MLLIDWDVCSQAVATESSCAEQTLLGCVRKSFTGLCVCVCGLGGEPVVLDLWRIVWRGDAVSVFLRITDVI